MDAKSAHVKADPTLSLTEHPSSAIPIATPDRHQGWHTEFREVSSTHHQTRPATDYVVRTSFIREGSPAKSSEGNRVNLVLRFRSLLSRRSQPHHTHAGHHQRASKIAPLNRRSCRDKLRGKRPCGPGNQVPYNPPPAPLTPTVISVDTCQDYESDASLKRANSDSCLSRPHIHSHAIYLRVPNSHIKSSDSPASVASHLSDSPIAINGSSAHKSRTGSSSRFVPPVGSQSDTEDSSFKTPEQNRRSAHVRRRSSLSTGNICCLYALRCLPSIEYLNTPASPATVRRRSLPASSIKPYPHYDRDRGTGIVQTADTPFALAAMRHHPCYQDVACNLRNWIKETLDMHSSKESILNDNTENTTAAVMSSIHSSTEWTRHVRFADEATASSSATTLNSLSASSSARSLSSLVLTPNTRSPFGSITSLERSSNSSDKQHSLTGLSSKLSNLRPIPRRLLNKFSQLSTSRPTPTSNKNATLSLPRTPGAATGKLGKSDHGEKGKSLARSIWRRRSKRHRERKTTPLVTVNVIHNYSEPPEVPKHVLKELEPTEEQSFWQPMFTNPEELPQFNQNLYKQRLHLARLWSFTLSAINVEVHVVVSPCFGDDSSPQIRLRYTLNNWETYAESCELTKRHSERRTLSPCETFWIEVHSGRIQLLPDNTNDAQPKPERLEFAVVSRRGGSEWWDNNHSQNYACYQQQTGAI
ncbi:unnamed protein product [Echinostoma caproni]|uniref:CBM21 domain-containing protein n=1 Tax=Echinostoma caproni TaxID=27848 RepID=A0A183AI03_9TREM|nr:unnamed protein product [Echinostoma caproni]